MTSSDEPVSYLDAGEPTTVAWHADVRFAELMADYTIAGTAADVLGLCRALHDATGMLGLDSAQEADLQAHIARAERAASADPADQIGMGTELRALRYLLVEVADGPIAAFMADNAARIIGDGVGRLFS